MRLKAIKSRTPRHHQHWNWIQIASDIFIIRQIEIKVKEEEGGGEDDDDDEGLESLRMVIIDEIYSRL